MISLAYQNQVMGLFLAFDILNFQTIDYVPIFINISILMFLLGYIRVIYRHVKKNRDNLSKMKFIENVEKMYPGVCLQRL